MGDAIASFLDQNRRSDITPQGGHAPNPGPIRQQWGPLPPGAEATLEALGTGPRVKPPTSPPVAPPVTPATPQLTGGRNPDPLTIQTILNAIEQAGGQTGAGSVRGIEDPQVMMNVLAQRQRLRNGF